MKRTLIQKSSTSIVKRLIEQVESLSGLEHHLTNGELKELFVARVLTHFIPSQYGLGSGVVINKDGEQSHQTDIIVYDKRFLPPFIKEQHIGVYPVETVLATIEVKSKLYKKGKDGLIAIDKKAALLCEIICENTLLENIKAYQHLRYPFCTAVGFNKVKDLSNKNSTDWLRNNLKYISGICFINCCSWLKKGKGWDLRKADETNEETKRFIAVLFDNIWRHGEARFRLLMAEKDKDWLSWYTRR